MIVVVKRGFTKKLVTLGVLSSLVIGSFAGLNQETAKANTAETPEIKNVIFLIGDGMGPSTVTAHRYMMDDPSTKQIELTEFDKYLVGMQTTYPDDPAQNITDSASAATAMASGIKTYNNAIGMDNEKNPYETVLEQAKEDGKATGLVATSEVTHATPASYGAHDESRKNMDAIANDYFDELVNGNHKIDVILGGGSKNFVPEDGRKIDDRNLAEEFQKKGYSYVTNKEELMKDDNGQVLGLFATGGLPKMIDRDDSIPSLQEMTSTAIERLSKDEQGFFLMVEGSQIDWAEHDNDIVGTMSEMNDFEQAFKAAIDFAKQDEHTLVVTTADHATGGLSLGANTKAQPNGDYNFHVNPIQAFSKTPDYIAAEIYAAGAGADVVGIMQKHIDSSFYNQITSEEIQAVKDAAAATDGVAIDNAIEAIVNDHSVTGWTTGGHTGEDVPVYAFGPQSERFAGLIDNTDQAKIIFQLLEENKMPETPEVPENPETPEVPENPETPEVPENPETPEVPENPETPEVPENPETPEVPENPETPEVPENPETPETPETPGDETEQPKPQELKVTVKDGKATIDTEDLKSLEEGSTAVLDFKDAYNVELSLSKEQIELLKAKNIDLHLKNKDVKVIVPFENLPEGDVKIKVERMKDIDDALSAVYDFTIFAGDKAVHQFKEKMTLEFNVTGEVEKEEDVKLFYYNEEDKKWELVGGEYKNGVVTAGTDHFSSFTVFELEMDNAKDVDKLKKLPATEGGYGLPQTATNVFNLLGVGIVVLLAAGAIFFYQRRKTKLNV